MSTLSHAARNSTKNVAKLVGNSSSTSTTTSLQKAIAQVQRRGMASGKEIRFGVEGRAAMLRGVDLLADAVQVRYR